ncbi:efflux RND transporter periplasmic adaptor subunit [Noviherbaspirillum sp. UKPF54]|uniref:efflux RND transporter periplasmic adaptor subunit n=1 Tax=Noviherbaspirillum sp. UKPF54 TaxID=2601898 RepID=UPI0011B1B128|nr:efflux RND transporter periplasmic adaptor subunit [Noviherbaspirillum sp. UKPF54]QDZ26770.1 efflux RND transporter periplasmic adaptor subunit [Noviherbaspirillum sp. UKPF54]
MDSRIEAASVQTTERRPRRVRTWLGALAAAALLLALLWMLFAPDPIQVELAAVTQGPMQVTVDNQGQVRAHDKYVVAAPVAAGLLRVELHDGDPVRRGQRVATLDPLPMDARQRQEAAARLDAARALAREAALRVQRADTDLRFAAGERARVERLIAERFVSPQALDKALSTENAARAEASAAQSRTQAAQADVRAAEAALLSVDSKGEGRNLELASPVDGYVLKVNEKSARTVAAGTPLVTIGDPARYEIVVDVLSTDAVKVKPGDTMLLEGWGGAKTLRAKVRLVEPVAFTKVSALGVEEQRVNVIADPVDALGPLGDGYRIEARIVIWSDDKAVKVTGSSLFRVGGAWHVFVADDKHAREREVQVGQRNQDEAQILSGLAPGTKVVRYPNNQLADGARIAAAGSDGTR